MVFWTGKIYIHLCTVDDDYGGHNDHINELSFGWWRPRSYAPHNLLFSICFSFFQCRGCSPEKLTANANYLSWPSQSMSYPSGVRGAADKVSGIATWTEIIRIKLLFNRTVPYLDCLTRTQRTCYAPPVQTRTIKWRPLYHTQSSSGGCSSAMMMCLLTGIQIRSYQAPPRRRWSCFSPPLNG